MQNANTTVELWLREAELRLIAAKVEAPRIEAQQLAAHMLRVSRSWLLAHPDHAFNELAGEQLLQRRFAGEPLAYILGWREFYGRPFGVDESVLIPRHETETVIDLALELSPPRETCSVLDLGTGSGILAITIKHERQNWNITAVDISPEAVATASANARFLKAKIRLMVGDLFAPLLGESFDLIVSNPPYVAETELLPPEIAQHEPKTALYGGKDGLDVYRRLASEAPAHLNDGGLLILELGQDQSEAVREIFESVSWRHVQSKADLAGIPRAIAFRSEDF